MRWLTFAVAVAATASLLPARPPERTVKFDDVSITERLDGWYAARPGRPEVQILNVRVRIDEIVGEEGNERCRGRVLVGNRAVGFDTTFETATSRHFAALVRRAAATLGAPVQGRRLQRISWLDIALAFGETSADQSEAKADDEPEPLATELAGTRTE